MGGRGGPGAERRLRGQSGAGPQPGGARAPRAAPSSPRVAVAEAARRGAGARPCRPAGNRRCSLRLALPRGDRRPWLVNVSGRRCLFFVDKDGKLPSAGTAARRAAAAGFVSVICPY